MEIKAKCRIRVQKIPYFAYYVQNKGKKKPLFCIFEQL